MKRRFYLHQEFNFVFAARRKRDINDILQMLQRLKFLFVTDSDITLRRFSVTSHSN
jgi:hypothetical protein